MNDEGTSRVDLAARPRPAHPLLLARAAQAFQVAVFVAWSYPGLYDLAVHVLHVQGQLGLPGGWHLERAHLYPLGVDGGIVTAFVLLLSDRGQIGDGHRRELWSGMWACAGLSALGLMVDAVKAGAGWAAPLVVIPVALGTWFLHMVVERRRDQVVQVDKSLDQPARQTPDPAVATLTAELARLRESIPLSLDPAVLDSLRQDLLDQVQSMLDSAGKARSSPTPSPTPTRSRAKAPEPPGKARSEEWTEAVGLLRASGVIKQTAYNRANAAERDGRLSDLIADLRTPRPVHATG